MNDFSAKHIDLDLLDNVSDQAKISVRRRMNYNFHQPQDIVQRFLNAIEPDSYIHPHRHFDPPKDEIFLVLRGKGAVFTFKDNGEVDELYILNVLNNQWGVDIPAGLYHTIISLDNNTVFYEVKAGPYNPTADKGFAPWAPEENTPESKEYLEKLVRLTR